MKCRILACAGIFAALAGTALLMLYLMSPSVGVSKSNFGRIEIGMSKADVEALFDRRCDDLIFPATNLEVDGEALEEYLWSSKDGYAFVAFANDRVWRKTWRDTPRTSQQKIRDLIHLP
jgi:hypothetical protein